MTPRSTSEWLSALSRGEGTLEGDPQDQEAARAAASRLAEANFRFSLETISELVDTADLQAVAGALENASKEALSAAPTSTARFAGWMSQAEAIIEAFRVRDGIVVGDPGVAAARRIQTSLESALTLSHAPVPARDKGKTRVAFPALAIALAVVAIGTNLRSRPATPTEKAVEAFSDLVSEVSAKDIVNDTIVLTVTEAWWDKPNLQKAEDLSALRVSMAGEPATGLVLQLQNGTVVAGWRGLEPFLEDPLGRVVEAQRASAATRLAEVRSRLLAGAPATIRPTATAAGAGPSVLVSAKQLASLGGPEPDESVFDQARANARRQAETVAAPGAVPAEPEEADLRFYVPLTWFQAAHATSRARGNEN